ncbi:FAD/NAD(P)-binding protein [Saccharopolyspora taberi]|uniref:FAD/NAD(P)-binding protein n=1 Tax=Saccharopolyspora taberi TaxID=60895 RepID=A0ABN3VCC9_9PSEU
MIGAGPRGLSVAERLCANVSAVEEPPKRLHVHIVDPQAGRGGRVWATSQSGRLLMNTIASQITMFTDETVDCVGPVDPGPSLHEWASAVAMDPTYDFDEQVRREAAQLGPNSYPSRALYGHYLNWVLRRLTDHSPEHVTVHVHPKTAISLEDGECGLQLVRFDDGTALTDLDAVVLAQGHVPMPLTERQQRLSDFATRNDLVYVGPQNPAEVDLSAIRPGEGVALRGLGLNFFDYMILLTEERGGRFTREDGRLIYRPSGREPVLYAGSRRGVPYHARGENEKGAFGRHVPRFLTDEVIEHFQRCRQAGLPVEFRADVWPLIDLEVRLVYYSALLAEHRSAADVADFEQHYVIAAGAGQTAENAVLDLFGIADERRWQWDRIARPYGDRVFGGLAEFERWLVGYLRGDHAEARRGNVSSPLKAALDVLRDLRNEIRLVVDHGGITGRSYQEEVQQWYTPFNAYLSVGPPARRIEEMIALMESGVLHVVGPEMRVDPAPDGAGFLVDSDVMGGEPVRVRSVIEARLPEVDMRASTDPLLGKLFREGRARPYRIPDGSTQVYETGGIAVTGRPYHLVDANGSPNPRRFAYGVPTEAVHWVTAAGIRPGVNSVILSDADAIARRALAIAHWGSTDTRIAVGRRKK